ncbi:MAG: hypothetical protein ACKVVP_19405, partial [Chloroflexota bacterium]
LPGNFEAAAAHAARMTSVRRIRAPVPATDGHSPTPFTTERRARFPPWGSCDGDLSRILQSGRATVNRANRPDGGANEIG